MIDINIANYRTVIPTQQLPVRGLHRDLFMQNARVTFRRTRLNGTSQQRKNSSTGKECAQNSAPPLKNIACEMLRLFHLLTVKKPKYVSRP